MVALIDQARTVFLDVSIGSIYYETVLCSQYLKLEVQNHHIFRKVINFELTHKTRRNVIDANDRLEAQTQRDGLEL